MSGSNSMKDHLWGWLTWAETDLLCEQYGDLGEQLTSLAELVLWHSPVSLVGGELRWLAGGCCSFRISVLAPEAVLNMKELNVHCEPIKTGYHNHGQQTHKNDSREESSLVLNAAKIHFPQLTAFAWLF